MEELKFVSLATTYSIDESFDSERFIKMRLKICHDGINPNGSSFDVRDIKKAETSISNTPILANTLVDEELKTVDLGGHDFHLEKNKLKEDEFKIIYDELIVGVIPETNNYEVIECDGKQYAFADCYIFREYSNYFEDFIEENQESKLSMEIFVDESNYDKKNNTYAVTKFRYKGITFLGKNYGTGMIGAKAVVSNFEEKETLFTLLSDLKSEIERYQFSLHEMDINKFAKKEDEHDLEEKIKLLEQYNLSVDSLDFSIEDMSLEDLKSKLDESGEDKSKNFVLNGNFMEELIGKLSAEKMTSEWGEYSKYCYVDHDTELNEVYCWDRQDWKLYGFTFSVSGDVVEIDFACKKRKKFSIVDFIDGTDSEMTFENAIKDVFDAVINTKNTEVSTLKEEFESYKTEYSTTNEEVEKLKSFRNDVLVAQRNEQESEIFEKFNKELADDQEYEALKTNCKELSLDEISNKCFSIYGKKLAKFSLNSNKRQAVKIPTVNQEENKNNESPYGDVYEKYLNK